MKKIGKGFIPVMLTPFKEDGAVDYDGLAALTEFYLSAGAIGLFANCLSGEMFELTPEERLDATRAVVRCAAGRVPVVATGNFGATVAKQADFVRQMADTGVDAVILVTGLMAGHDETDDVFERNTMELLHLTEKIPLGFYECPKPYKRVLSAAQLKMFLNTNRVIYHKDTCLDIHQVRAKLAVARGFRFGLYDAYLGHAVASLRAGAAGLSCIQGNFFPEVIVWLCKNFDSAALQNEVERVQQFLIAQMEVMHAAYPGVAKYYLQQRGLDITTRCRSGAAGIDATAREGMDRLFRDCTQLKADLGIRP